MPSSLGGSSLEVPPPSPDPTEPQPSLRGAADPFGSQREEAPLKKALPILVALASLLATGIVSAAPPSDACLKHPKQCASPTPTPIPTPTPRPTPTPTPRPTPTPTPVPTPIPTPVPTPTPIP